MNEFTAVLATEDGGEELVAELLSAEDALLAIGLSELDAISITGVVQCGDLHRAVQIAVTYGGAHLERAAGEIVNTLAARLEALV